MNRRSKPETQKELEEQIGRALCSRAESIPVSYTHLDVYKRQGLHTPSRVPSHAV